MKSYLVDFRNEKAKGKKAEIAALLGYGSHAEPPVKGEKVLLEDENGCSCIGRVYDVRSTMARVRPDWNTWRV